MQLVNILVMIGVDKELYKYNNYVYLPILWIKHCMQELLEMAPHSHSVKQKLYKINMKPGS